MKRACKYPLAVMVLLLSVPGMAQDMEPRAYSASPVGLNFFALAFGRSSGSVLFDPTLPITNVETTFNSANVGLGRTFGFFGRQALVTAGLPYVWGHGTGDVEEQSRTITRSGLADMRMKFSVNLYGNPARSPAEFRLRKDSLIIGTSLSIVAPTGQYDPTKLVNLGTNRWALKPELGISYPYKNFYFDVYFGAWFFANNNAFFPGKQLREQDPIKAVQGHISYTFRKRLWVAADATWYQGGATSIDNGPFSIEQKNSRAGLTVSLPLNKRQSLKFAYSSGATTSRLGSDFRTIGIIWQYSWFGLLPRR